MKKLLNLAGADWSVGNKVHQGIDGVGQGFYTPVVSVERLAGNFMLPASLAWGIFMRNSGIYAKAAIFFLITLCINLSGCIYPDPESGHASELTVVNESSHDLRVVFVPIPPYRGFNSVIDLNQGKTTSSMLTHGFGTKENHYNPNQEGIKIILHSLVEGRTGEKIKEMNTLDKAVELFEFMG
ncbi:MAG: hypothetical protein FWE09_03450, partial [Treponema sp.]|nr:hypothetical protein [Treponema sp.]